MISDVGVLGEASLADLALEWPASIMDELVPTLHYFFDISNAAQTNVQILV